MYIYEKKPHIGIMATSLIVKLSVVFVVVGVLGKVLLESDQGLKLRVAVGLFGYDGLFNIVKHTAAERLVGKKTTKSRKAFHGLLDAAGEAELEYLSPMRGVVTEQDIAEGIRLVTHILRAALLSQVESDISTPKFVEMVSDTRKYLGDNPDARYFSCWIDPSKTYLVKGKRHKDEVYTSFTLAEAPCMGCFSTSVIHDINNFQLEMKDDGLSFELYIAKEKPGPSVKNWIPINLSKPGMSLQIITRHYFELAQSVQTQRQSKSPFLSIDTFPTVATVSDFTRSDIDMERRLENAQRFLKEHTVGVSQDPKKAPSWFSFESNVFGIPKSFREEGKEKKEGGGGLGAVDITYSAAPWLFSEENEALLIEGLLPTKCKFVSAVLWNRYMQTLDYHHHQVSLNRKQMKSLRKVDENYSRFKIMLSARAPPADSSTDWLDTMGRKSGTVFWRFILPPPGVHVPPINSTVIKL